MMKGREGRDNKCPPSTLKIITAVDFFWAVFAVHAGHHQQKYPETEEDCVTGRQTQSRHWITTDFRLCVLIQHSTDQPTESTLQGVQELMKKEKEKERKKRKSELLLLLPTQTEQNRDNTSVGGHESCTERHWLVPHWLCLINEWGQNENEVRKKKEEEKWSLTECNCGLLFLSSSSTKTHTAAAAKDKAEIMKII